MKTQLSIALAVAFGTASLSAQPTKRLEQNSKNDVLQKTFYVLKADGGTKHGAYEEIYAETLITKGQYDMGKRTGKWEFFSYLNPINFSGYFTDGEKDGHWTYFRNDTLLFESFYTQGTYDSLFVYFDKDRPSIQTRLDSSGNGNTYTYYKSGVVKEHSPLKNHKIDGTVTLRYGNGNLYRRVEYREGKPWNLLGTFDRQGAALDGGTLRDGSGNYAVYNYTDPGEQTTLTQTASYKDGVLHGPYTEYSPEGHIIKQGLYALGTKVGVWIERSMNGSMEKYEYSNRDSTLQVTAPSLMATSVGEGPHSHILPTFQAGEDQMMRYLALNLSYPKSAKSAGVQGIVYIAFDVNSEGFLDDIEIQHSPDEKLNDECIRLISNMPRWNPGFEDGIPVKVRYTLPIRFKMR